MRVIAAGMGLGVLLLLSGCDRWLHKGGTGGDVGGARVSAVKPTADQLVAYLNDNARRVQALQCGDVQIDAKQNGQAVGLMGKLVCEKPRNFRLQGQVVGKPAVDIGSNNEEFWFWVSENKPPYVFHCTYQDYGRGNVNLPFPFQPDWIMEALGVGEYPTDRAYKLNETQTTLELVEQSTSPQGQPVQKVTVFNRAPALSGRPQVTARMLKDARGQVICAAYITDVQPNPESGATLPRRVQLVWPAQKMEMKMKLDQIQVRPIGQGQREFIFTRKNLSNLPSYDLARGPDGPSGPVQPAGGFR